MAFLYRHLGNNTRNVGKMLRVVDNKIASINNLVEKIIPKEIKCETKNSFAPITEHNSLENIEQKFKNVEKDTKKYMIGKDFNDSILPTVIVRNLLENPKWYTAYTPYQAEISQGRLESLFNFQTLICELTDLPMSNCSLLDSASAATEALNMAFNFHKTKRNSFFCDEKVHPVVKEVIKTRARLLGINVTYDNIWEHDFEDTKYCGVIFSYPNIEGNMFVNQAKLDKIKESGALLASHNDILSLLIFKPPGAYGIDISFGTTQRFGLPLWNGGPHSAFFATSEKLLRLMPGRMVGESVCRNGNPAYRLALQTREQHIKKERASSNICTSQALLANTSTFWAIYHGKEGMINTAIDILAKKNVMNNILSKLESRIKVDYFNKSNEVNDNDFYKERFTFDNIKFTTIQDNTYQLHYSLKKAGYITNLDNGIIDFSINEKTTIEDLCNIYYIIVYSTGNNPLEVIKHTDINFLVNNEIELLRDILINNRKNRFTIEESNIVSPKIRVDIDFDKVSNLEWIKNSDSFRRYNQNNISSNKPFLDQSIFKEGKSETWLARYMHDLADKDYSLMTGMIPLGSCTMKLNSTTQMMPLSWEELQNVHPFSQELNDHDGYNRMIRDLSDRLLEMTGMDAINYQSNSGAMGELSGLAVIKMYHETNRGAIYSPRDTILIPESAHGTNYSSAKLAGFKIHKFKDSLTMSEFKELLEKLGDKMAGLMITYPTTYGLFNHDIKEICDAIHENGGLVYMDGANMNAQCGLTSPKDCGADICHLNLHKTFCIPHGGGGPGMGPICVTNALKDFLPSNPLVRTEYCGSVEKSYGSITMSPNASASILSIPLIYLQTMGSQGVTEASKHAILNANYLKEKLKDHYTIFEMKGGDVQYNLVGHEFIVTLEEFSKYNISDKDIAKRLIDYNFHPPTMSWPIPKSIMIEPTESEDLEELDRFIDAMIKIREEIDEIIDEKYPNDNNVLTNAPHSLDDIVEWNHPYSIEKALYPLETLRNRKHFPKRSRINDIWGDRNLKVKLD